MGWLSRRSRRKSVTCETSDDRIPKKSILRSSTRLDSRSDTDDIGFCNGNKEGPSMSMVNLRSSSPIDPNNNRILKNVSHPPTVAITTNTTTALNFNSNSVDGIPISPTRNQRSVLFIDQVLSPKSSSSNGFMSENLDNLKSLDRNDICGDDKPSKIQSPPSSFASYPANYNPSPEMRRKGNEEVGVELIGCSPIPYSLLRDQSHNSHQYENESDQLTRSSTSKVIRQSKKLFHFHDLFNGHLKDRRLSVTTDHNFEDDHENQRQGRRRRRQQQQQAQQQAQQQQQQQAQQKTVNSDKHTEVDRMQNLRGSSTHDVLANFDRLKIHSPNNLSPTMRPIIKLVKSDLNCTSQDRGHVDNKSSDYLNCQSESRKYHTVNDSHNIQRKNIDMSTVPTTRSTSTPTGSTETLVGDNDSLNHVQCKLSKYQLPIRPSSQLPPRQPYRPSAQNCASPSHRFASPTPCITNTTNYGGRQVSGNYSTDGNYSRPATLQRQSINMYRFNRVNQSYVPMPSQPRIFQPKVITLSRAKINSTSLLKPRSTSVVMHRVYPTLTPVNKSYDIANSSNDSSQSVTPNLNRYGRYSVSPVSHDNRLDRLKKRIVVIHSDEDEIDIDDDDDEIEYGDEDDIIEQAF